MLHSMMDLTQIPVEIRNWEEIASQARAEADQASARYEAARAAVQALAKLQRALSEVADTGAISALMIPPVITD